MQTLQATTVEVDARIERRNGCMLPCLLSGLCHRLWPKRLCRLRQHAHHGDDICINSYGVLLHQQSLTRTLPDQFVGMSAGTLALFIHVLCVHASAKQATLLSVMSHTATTCWSTFLQFRAINAHIVRPGLHTLQPMAPSSS